MTENQATHTPGPWSINSWQQPTSDIRIGASGTSLAARVPLRDVSINEQLVNARLIAAAPEILGALKLLHEHCRAMSTEYRNGLGDTDAIYTQVNAAIAKATGLVR